MKIKNKVQLITYPDSLGGDLKSLFNVLNEYFDDIFPGGIHILPPFPSSGDRGFASITYKKIDPKFGTWKNIKKIAGKYDIMLDLMANHISRRSEFFQDFLKHGRRSKYADMFITIDKIWPNGHPSREEIKKIFLRRDIPYSEYPVEDTGEIETIWTTFGKTTPSEQIDIDIHPDITKQFFRDVLNTFSKNNIKYIRLDAIGYVIKKPGSTCFFEEPEIYEFLAWIRDLAHGYGIEILPEIHAHYSIHNSLSAKDYWTYDFILPYIILSSIINQNCRQLKEYLRVRPHNQFTMLDCHDGIAVNPDLNDVVSSEDAREIVNICVKRGANLSPIFSPAHQADDGFNVHQIRGTYFSMLNGDDDAYLAARAVQFFTPGIPQVYYVGLLAGENDFSRFEETGDGREINRHNFSIKEIKDSVKNSNVQRLLKLIRFRNEYPAFNGEFQVMDSTDDRLMLMWKKDHNYCKLKLDLKTNKSKISYTGKNGATLSTDV